MITTDLSLNSYILTLDIADSENDIDSKLEVVHRFNLFVEQSVKDILSDSNIITKAWRHSLCKVCTHGSTELRTSLKNSDIDIVLVLPNYLSRAQWFTRVVEKFELNPAIIQDMVPVIETFVPVIKLKYQGVQFDVVISCLALPFVPSKIEFRVDANSPNKIPSLYHGVDITSIRGLSSIHILRTIKLQIERHKEIFTEYIRAIKIWTLKREIDSYIFGFPSAIAWVLMAFYVYQRISQGSTKLTVIRLLKCFFNVFQKWNWPTAVVINQSSSCDQPYIDASKYENHLMPVISLVYPYKNTAFTVRQSSLAVICEEFKRAHLLLQGQYDSSIRWKRLFADIDISNEYRHFIHLELMCVNDSFIRFKGLIASKLRDYATQLENISQIVLARIHSIDEQHNRKVDADRKRNHSWIIGIKLVENVSFKDFGIRTSIDINEATQCFFHILNEKCPYNNFQKMLNIKYVKGRAVLDIIGC